MDKALGHYLQSRIFRTLHATYRLGEPVDTLMHVATSEKDPDLPYN